DIDDRFVGVRADLEGAGDGQRAIARRRGAEVGEVLDAGKLLLDRRRDGARQRLGARARIAGVDHDRRRRDLRVLRDRQHLRGDESRQRDDDRDDPGEDRPVDEELREGHGRCPYLAGGCDGAALAAGASVTGTPGRIFSRLSTITLSPVFSPDMITQSGPIQSPVFTVRACALPSASTTNTRYAFSVCTTAACGTRNTLSRSPAVMRTVTNWPGRSCSRGLSNSARSCCVPSLASSAVAAKLGRHFVG